MVESNRRKNLNIIESPITFSTDDKSVAFSAGKRMLSFNSLPVNIGNNWSVQFSAKRTSSSAEPLFSLSSPIPPFGTFTGAVTFYWSEANSNYFLVLTRAGGDFKTYRYLESDLPINNWGTIVVTWDGSNLKLYVNGSFKTPTIISQDDAGTLIINDGFILVSASIFTHPSSGPTWIGRIHSGAAWNKVLTSSEVTEIYNSAAPGEFDLRENSGNYVSSENLLHWWRLGLDPNRIGKDYGRGHPIDIMHDATNISASDIVTDSP